MMVRRILENKWAMFVLIAFIYFARNYFRFFDNALWAEDGKIFLAQSYELGWDSIFNPYNGYLHILIRVFVLLLSKIPLLIIPTAFHISAYLVTMYTVFIIISSKLDIEKIYKNLLALTLVTVVASSGHGIDREIFIILTNVQWFTCFILILHIMENYNNRFRVLPIVHALIFGLQGPFSVLLAPFAILKGVLIREKSLSYWFFTLVLTATGVMQYYIGWHRFSQSHHIKLSLWLHQFFALIANYLGNFSALYVLLLIVVLRKLYLKSHIIQLGYLAGLNLLALLSIASAFRMVGFVFTPEMVGRYFFIVYILFNWTLVYIISFKFLNNFYIYSAKILFLIGLLYMCKSFFTPINNSYCWKDQVENYKADRGYQFTEAPGQDNWKFKLLK